MQLISVYRPYLVLYSVTPGNYEAADRWVAAACTCLLCLCAVEPLFIGATETGAMLLHGIVPDTDFTSCVTIAVVLTTTQCTSQSNSKKTPRVFSPHCLHLYLLSHSPLASLPPLRLLLMKAAPAAPRTLALPSAAPAALETPPRLPPSVTVSVAP